MGLLGVGVGLEGCVVVEGEGEGLEPPEHFLTLLLADIDVA